MNFWNAQEKIREATKLILLGDLHEDLIVWQPEGELPAPDGVRVVMSQVSSVADVAKPRVVQTEDEDDADLIAEEFSQMYTWRIQFSVQCAVLQEDTNAANMANKLDLGWWKREVQNLLNDEDASNVRHLRVKHTIRFFSGSRHGREVRYWIVEVTFQVHVGSADPERLDTLGDLGYSGKVNGEQRPEVVLSLDPEPEDEDEGEEEP